MGTFTLRMRPFGRRLGLSQVCLRDSMSSHYAALQPELGYGLLVAYDKAKAFESLGGLVMSQQLADKIWYKQ